MVEDRGTLRAIAWQQVFPSLRLLTALRMALNFKALVLAAIAVSGMVAGWRILGNLYADGENSELAAQIEYFGTWPWEEPVDSASLERLVSLETWQTQSPLLVAWTELTAPFVQIYKAPSFVSFTFLLCCALWSLVVWSFFGACITRMAAVGFARHENASLGQTAAFVSPRLLSYFAAPLFPILGTFLIAAFMAVLGLLMRTDLGILAASIGWFVGLLGSFMMAFMLLGLFFGFPLMWGSISAEGTDSFGALSHSYSYVYQRPLQYLIYVVIAAIIGVLGWYLVLLFAYWILELSGWGVGWGSGSARLAEIKGPDSMGPIADTGAAIIAFWTDCVRTLAFGFIFSYFWTASTVIYFLLRRLVDATELDEVFMPDEQDQHGLPPLKTGPDGMPRAVDDPVSEDVESGGKTRA